MNRAVMRLQPAEPRTSTVNCCECHGRGVIKLWSPGKPETAHMGRCEQCSGLGRINA